MAAKPITEEQIKTGGVAADRLRSIVERIERLEEERKALGSDIKDIYQEAKSAGFDVKVLRQLIRIRKQEAAEVEELETMLDVYRRALGMNPDHVDARVNLGRLLHEDGEIDAAEAEYRQALEHLHGVRDEPSTRALIAQENRRYARRQLIWFRKEPNLVWCDGPGESSATIAAVSRLVDQRLQEVAR